MTTKKIPRFEKRLNSNAEFGLYVFGIFMALCVSVSLIWGLVVIPHLDKQDKIAEEQNLEMKLIEQVNLTCSILSDASETTKRHILQKMIIRIETQGFRRLEFDSKIREICPERVP